MCCDWHAGPAPADPLHASRPDRRFTSWSRWPVRAGTQTHPVSRISFVHQVVAKLVAMLVAKLGMPQRASGLKQAGWQRRSWGRNDATPHSLHLAAAAAQRALR